MNVVFYVYISLSFFKSKDGMDGKTGKQVFEFFQFFSLYLFCSIDEAISKACHNSSLDGSFFFPRGWLLGQSLQS